MAMYCGDPRRGFVNDPSGSCRRLRFRSFRRESLRRSLGIHRHAHPGTRPHRGRQNLRDFHRDRLHGIRREILGRDHRNLRDRVRRALCRVPCRDWAKSRRGFWIP